MKNSNKNQVDELRQANEIKLNGLNKELKDNDATLKSHRHELEVVFIELRVLIQPFTVALFKIFIFQMFSNTRGRCLTQQDAAKRKQIQLFDEKSMHSTRSISREHLPKV